MPEVALIREASHEAAGLHQNRLRVRWRMAIGRLRAAARETAAHRNTRFGPDRVAAVDCRFDRASAGTRLDRGRHERRKADIIVTYGSAVPVLRQTITSIPIVFAVAFDPVRSGLVQSLAHPAGNVTGVSIQQPDLVGKRLELLRQAIPKLRRLAILADAGYAEPMLEADRVKSMAQAFGLEAARVGVWRAEDIAPAFETLRNKADALYVVSDALIAANRARIVTLALDGRLPTIMSYDDYVEAGGLMSYGPDYADLFRRAAAMVDKILRGTNPGDIPVEQPTKFEFAINVKTAAALGLTIPQTLLATVDEVVK